ncbi:hypothetical protein [Allomesorhizobium alhagi]|jgi:hypothetical protein|uniref:hypothetical protein n=1 Tax=Allomesorhizobium alhagi TaxID=475067 RepID=UPI001111B79C|nr:hypothetical protein [Mesorhizobium alhagi]
MANRESHINGREPIRLYAEWLRKVQHGIQPRPDNWLVGVQPAKDQERTGIRAPALQFYRPCFHAIDTPYVWELGRIHSHILNSFAYSGKTPWQLTVAAF